MGEQLKRSADSASAPTTTRLIATTGEVFADGSTIELIGGQGGDPSLMLWDGANETVGSRIEHSGRVYKPAPFDVTVLRELTLPTRSCPHGTTREFLAETSELVTNFVGLPEKWASLVARFVLTTALIDAVSVAPLLVIVGQDIARGNRLVLLLRCLCRRPLRLTGVTADGFRALASGMKFTYLIAQSSVSDKLRKLLDDASGHDRKIPFHGRLLDLFGGQVIQTDLGLAGDAWPLRSIQIPMMPTGQELPVFDLNEQRQITDEFQAKLLNFRRANLGLARGLQFDGSKFALALQDLARSLAAATPDDIELQGELFDLLQEEDEEIRARRWIDPNGVAVEALLVVCKEPSKKVVYIAEVAKIAQEVMRRRGENLQIDPGAFGKRLKLLGFATGPRDAKGKKLRLTDAVRSHAERLARDLDIPKIVEMELTDASQ